MELTIREAATLTGRSPRTIRAQLARGDLQGVKRNGRWLVERRHLPLTEAQRRSLQTKAQSLRNAVDDALPSRIARSHDRRPRSLADLDAFRLGADLATEIRSVTGGELPEAVRDEVLMLLERSLFAVAEAAFQYDRAMKLEAVNRARADLSRTVARLLLTAGLATKEPFSSWLEALESEVLPAVGGYARWADGLGRRRR